METSKPLKLEISWGNKYHVNHFQQVPVMHCYSKLTNSVYIDGNVNKVARPNFVFSFLHLHIGECKGLNASAGIQAKTHTMYSQGRGFYIKFVPCLSSHPSPIFPLDYLPCNKTSSSFVMYITAVCLSLYCFIL